ncbi:unnamed protein product, partial [Closterium sp. NIES-54]
RPRQRCPSPSAARSLATSQQPRTCGPSPRAARSCTQLAAAHAACRHAQPAAASSPQPAHSVAARSLRPRVLPIATRSLQPRAASHHTQPTASRSPPACCLPAACCLLLPACLLPAAACLPACLLPAAACLQPASYLPACLLPAAACLHPACCLPAACLLPPACRLPAACLLLTACCLPATCCLLPPACRLPACLLAVCCRLPAACLLPPTCCLPAACLLPACCLPAACCLLLAACYRLPAACLLPACCLPATYCLLPACYLLPAAACLLAAWCRLPAICLLPGACCLSFKPDSRPIEFTVWLDDLQLFLLIDAKEGISLFDYVSGTAVTPVADARALERSQWQTRDAAARLAIRNHLPITERAHFSQHRTAKTLYDAVVARYSSPATAAIGRLMLPYLFPDLSSFTTAEDLVSHLRATDSRFLPVSVPSAFLTAFPSRTGATIAPVYVLVGSGSLRCAAFGRGRCRDTRSRGRSSVPRFPMEVARTSMIHAAAPHFLWPFAVRYAAHQLNLWPRVSLPETSPTVLWTGKVCDASRFWVWGARAFVRDTTADKLSPCAIPCVDPLPAPGAAPSGVSHVDHPAPAPVEVTGDSGPAASGAVPGGAELGGAESGGAERVEPGGAASRGTASGGAASGDCCYAVSLE